MTNDNIFPRELAGAATWSQRFNWATDCWIQRRQISGIAAVASKTGPRNGGEFWISATRHGKHVNIGEDSVLFPLPGGAITKTRWVKLFKVYHAKSLGK